MITNTGATFERQMPLPLPARSAATLEFILGAFVGIVPVAIGLMFYQRCAVMPRRMNFLPR